MQTCATHPKTALREEKSDKKKEERIGAQLVAEIMGPHPDTATFAISDPTWRPSSSHLQPTWAPQPESKCGAGLQRAFMEDPGPASLEAPPIATRHNAASITRRPSSPHAQPTWAPQPERKCGGRGAGDHACALAVDVAALLQLTAWVEKLDAINHMNGGEDQLIINIRSQAVGVLDAWTKRWYATHAMTDDARR